MNSFIKNNIDNTYIVNKVNQPIPINGDWSKTTWTEIEPLQVKEFMGEEPQHKPKVQVKVAYDEKSIYMVFRVKDRYVRCIRQNYQDPVYKDSAVEFFFSPSEDLSLGYFNLEINCGGTALFKFRSQEKGTVWIPKTKFEQIEISHSLPKVVDPEVASEVTWTIEMRIPVHILNFYYPVNPPASGAKWRANFFKIADESSYPHYLTWSKVIYPEPNFHLPQFFGTLIFE